jgi:hypothetical protein
VITAAVFAVTALTFVGAFVADKAALRSNDDSLVIRCERLSGVVGRNVVEHGLAADSADWRRQKQLSFRACIDDYAAFERLIAAQ